MAFPGGKYVGRPLGDPPNIEAEHSQHQQMRDRQQRCQKAGTACGGRSASLCDLASAVRRAKLNPPRHVVLFAFGVLVYLARDPAAFSLHATFYGEDGPALLREAFMCKIYYLISRTVSDDDPHCSDIDDRSVRAFAVKPAPSARRDAALGLTAGRGRAIRRPCR